MPNALARWLLATLLAAAALPLAPQERRSVDAPPAPPPPMTPEDERTVVHDVADLVERSAPRGADGTIAPEDRRAALTELVEIMRDNIRPDTLRDRIVGLGDGLIVVLGTELQQKLVAQFLDDLRTFSVGLFDVQFQQITLPAERAAALGLGGETMFLTGELASLPATLAELGRKDPAGELVSAPRVLVHNNQKAVIETTERIPYVADYVRYEAVEPTGAALVDPVVEFVEEGIAIDCHPILHHDEKHVTVELHAEFKRVQRPIEARAGELGPTCAPTVVTRRIDTVVIVPDGATVAFPAVTSEGRTSVLLMKIVRVDPQPR